MNDKEQELIKLLVEKVTKGVKKQIKGYVKSITDEIERSMSNIRYSIENFNHDYHRMGQLKSGLIAYEQVLEEGASIKKFKCEIQQMTQEMSNKMMDLKFLETEIKNQLNLRGAEFK